MAHGAHSKNILPFLQCSRQYPIVTRAKLKILKLIGAEYRNYVHIVRILVHCPS